MTASDDDARIMFHFLNEVSIVAQLAGNAFERAMAGDMTLPQFSVLNHLMRLGGDKTPLDLARAMQVAKGAMTNTLGHLDRAGYVSIAPDAKDGRSKRVSITAQGRAAHKAAIVAIRPELRYLLSLIPATRIDGATPVVEAVRKVLDQRRNRGSRQLADDRTT